MRALRPMPYPEICPPDEESYHPRSAVRTMFVDSVDTATAETIVDHLQASSAMMAVAQLAQPEHPTGRRGLLIDTAC